jgi:hypothetical protein
MVLNLVSVVSILSANGYQNTATKSIENHKKTAGKGNNNTRLSEKKSQTPKYKIFANKLNDNTLGVGGANLYFVFL